MRWLEKSEDLKEEDGESDPTAESLERLYGTYKGFAPNDDSPVDFSELEVIIDKESIRFTQLTELGTLEETAPASLLRIATNCPQTLEETEPSPLVKIRTNNQQQVSVSGIFRRPVFIEAYTVKGTATQFLFFPYKKKALVLYGNDRDDIAGPTLTCPIFLYRQRGAYQRRKQNG